MKGKFAIGCVVGGFLAAIPALAADPILQGPEPGPCAAAMAGPDYVPGRDASGQPVVPADVGAQAVPVPDQVLVPLPNRAGRGRGRGAQPGEAPYAAIDGQRLDRLVNPKPCPPPPPSRQR